MENIILKINKSFENRIRLGIMSILIVNDKIDFKTLKNTLQTSDGNIASHTTALEKEGYIQITKRFIGKKPNTSYSATQKGKKAFKEHLDALEKIINGSL
ncbi:MAG: transcriptional regulator [Marinilabiliales bacterium]|nr:MAG: transcriptional regulator [Marinilabiliales bacterium]